MKKVIDTHAHLDESCSNSAVTAAKVLNDSLIDCNIEKAVVLHLDFNKWSAEEVAEAISEHERLIGFVNIHPENPDAIRKLDLAISSLGFQGLKLHPRLQKFTIDSEKTIQLVQHAGKLNIPVIICGFPDGDWLMQGSTVLNYASLANACPDTRIVVAHMAGHHVIDMMMLVKRIPNLYMDTSYSLLYYRGSEVVKNLIYAMKSLKFKRIFYGSDYPDRSVKETLEQSIEIFDEYGLSEVQQSKVLYQNAKEFFG